MQKLSSKLILILLISSSFLPFFQVTARPMSTQITRFKIGVTGYTGNWDAPVESGTIPQYFASNALETLLDTTSDWSGDLDDLSPVLATDWEINYWPPEMNYHPDGAFINRGGIRAIELTLREGVTFHDGSAWNATVAKWNIDRFMVITGNITGKLKISDISDVYPARYDRWLNAEDWADYETDTWNVSQFIGQPYTYEGFGTSKDKNLLGQYCRIKNVTIIDNLPSGGTIKIYYNDWGGAGTQLIDLHSLGMISMDAYQDYFDLPIYSLGNNPEFPQPDITGVYPEFNYPSTGFPGHLIGTGPYIFIEQGVLDLREGFMIRNPNWWNTNAMQAQGWHKVPEIGIVYFHSNSTGLADRNLAMVNGTIDYALNTEIGPLVYNDMISDPDVNYYDMGVEAIRTFITLNQINETYWKTWADAGPGNYPPEVQARHSEYHDIDSDGTIHVDGINRALRKAVSFAFDYETYINVVKQGRAVRSGGFLGIENEYYNPDIPIAYRNLTIARQTLINDPFWSPLVTARGLTINNATSDWIWVAENDPIFEFKLLWENATQLQANVTSTSIKDIGIILGGLNGAPDPALELDPNIYEVMLMRLNEFPAFTYHGITTDWPDLNIGSLSVLDYYYKSPGLPYVNGSGIHWPSFNGGQFFNIGFHYNATVDDWMERGWFSDRTTLQEIMTNLTKHCQTYQYSEIFISHNKWGIAIDKDWVFSNYWGETSFEFIKYKEPIPPEISGYNIYLLICPLALISIVFIIKRNKKL